MAIGRFRDTPGEMDELEVRVAASQYPEGGLVFGTGLGLGLGTLSVDPVLVAAPLAGGVVGYALGRWYHGLKLERLRADATAGE